MLVNLWAKDSVNYDDLFGLKPQRKKVMTPEEQKALLARLDERRKRRRDG
jgi:hypothetical protein